MVEALIPSLISALNLGAAGTAAKGTVDMLNSGKTENTKVLEDDTPTTSTESKKSDKPYYQYLSKMDKDELMIDLVAGGLTTREAKEVMRTGYISKENFIKLPQELQRKLARLSGRDVDVLLAGIGGPDDENDNDNDNDKKEKNSLKDKVKREIDKAKNYAKGEKEFHENDPKEAAKQNRKHWGDKKVDGMQDAKEASRAKTNNLERYKEVTQMEKDDPRNLGNSPEQRAKQLERLRNEAIKNGNVDNWDYNHITPRTNLPVRP